MAVSPEAAAIIQCKKAQYCRFADSDQWDRFDSIMLPNATFLFHNPDGSLIRKGDIKYSWSSTKEREGGVHGTGGGHYHETWKRVGDDWFMESLRMERLYWKVLSV
ncbi:hypothetical protein ACKAV7_001819 [Fusarium commune]